MSVLALGVLCQMAVAGRAQDGHRLPSFTPKAGAVVAVYVHHFQKEKWAEARSTFQRKFYRQIRSDVKDLRDSFILENPEEAEILGITLWRSKKDLEDWEKQPERAKHQHELDAFRSRPFEAKRFDLLAMGSEVAIRVGHRPFLVPKAGSFVVVTTNWFEKARWNEVRTQFEKEIAQEGRREEKDVRDSYFLERPQEGEVMDVTVWRSKEAYEKWRSGPAAMHESKRFDPFRSRPAEVRQYRVLDEIIEAL